MRFKAVISHGRGWWGRLALALLALPVMIVAGTISAAASPAPTAPVGAHIGKPVPVRPPSSPGAGLGAAIPAKPHYAREVAPLTAWSVSLTASPNWLWPTQYSTLTATANMNVGPTPYYLRVYDETAGAYVVTCATGITCSVPVTQPTPTTHYYIAVVSYASSGYPPGGEQAASGTVGVVWQGVYLSLSASPTTVPVWAAATLTATTSADIGPSPFWTEIYDVTTQTRVAVCGYGTSCSATVSQSAATTHEYIAYLSNYSTAYPPAGIQETSRVNFITWSNLGWRVSLSAPSATYGSETVTAYANGNVGPTPYYIEIFNESTGTRLAECAWGSACSVTFTPSYSGSDLVAFISGYSTAFPPTGIVASSNVATSYLRIIP
jgi:hypothetical protein